MPVYALTLVCADGRVVHLETEQPTVIRQALAHYPGATVSLVASETIVTRLDDAAAIEAFLAAVDPVPITRAE